MFKKLMQLLFPKTKHAYGWMKDPFDYRDAAFYLSFPRKDLPKSVDLRIKVSEVSNQGSLGSCTGFAIADGLREHLLIKNQIPPMVDMSPLYIYYHERLLEGNIFQDSGAFIRDGMKVIANRGCATEASWPYIVNKFTSSPSEQAEQEAAKYKINSYHRLNNLQDIKNCLAEGYGCVFGFVVRASFELVGSDGKMLMPKFFEKMLGGHAVFCCGYVDDPSWPGGGYLIIKNSWGKDWGNKGFFYMPYKYVNYLNVQDIWTAR